MPLKITCSVKFKEFYERQNKDFIKLLELIYFNKFCLRNVM